MKHSSLPATVVLLLLGLLTGPVARAQGRAPAFEEAFSIGQMSGLAPRITAIAADTLGNVYIAGTFTGTVAFGATMLTAAGKRTTFVAKWNDAAHTYRWAVPVATELTRLAVGRDGVFVAGTIDSTTGKGLVVSATLPPYSNFVAKVTDEGITARIAWVQLLEAVGKSYCRVNSLVVQGASAFIAAEFTGTLHIGTLTVSSEGAETGLLHQMLAKITDAMNQGTVRWARQFSYANYTGPHVGLAVNGTAIYLAVSSSDRLLLGKPSQPDTDTLHTLDTSNPYLVILRDKDSTATFEKAILLPAGRPEPGITPKWAAATPVNVSSEVSALVAAGSAVYVAGTYQLSWTKNDRSKQRNCLFLLKLEVTTGTARLLWSQQTPQKWYYTAPCTNLALRGTDVYLVGPLWRSEQFGSLRVKQVGSSSLFMARCSEDKSGASFDWAERLEGAKIPRWYGSRHNISYTRTPNNPGWQLTLTNTGTLYLAATLVPSARLGTQVVVPKTATPSTDYLLRFTLPQ